MLMCICHSLCKSHAKQLSKKEKTVETISDYLDWVKTTHEVYPDDQLLFKQSWIYYRGQSDKDWPVTPGVFRTDKQGALPDESLLLKQARNKGWKYLKECKSELEQMIMFQHMGLKTRLLDITSNPLVALYFACLGDDKTDGCVYCCYGHSYIDDYGIAKIIAKAAFNKDCYNGERILELFEEFNVSKQNFQEQLSSTQIFEPVFNNERITAQRGAFIIAPLYKDKKYSFFANNFDYKEEPFSDNIAIIKGKYKNSILTELAEIGIDESSLFPDMTGLMSAINKNVFCKNKTPTIDM